MTDPTLTDEELETLSAIRRAKALPHDDRAWDAALVAERLIAALKASREEAAELRQKLTDANWPTLHAECDQRYERTIAEVERHKHVLTDLECDLREAADRLVGLASEMASPDTVDCLHAKAEGVRLALSYLHNAAVQGRFLPHRFTP